MTPFFPSLEGATRVSYAALEELAEILANGGDRLTQLVKPVRTRQRSYLRPQEPLSRILKDFNGRYLGPRYEAVAADHVHGYRPRRTIVTNATPHLNANIVLCVDLAGFFEQIEPRRVLQALERLQTSERDRSLAIRLAVPNGKLPIGFHTSPTLSNIAFIETDDWLSKFAEEHRVALTRYADDITVSGPVSDSTLSDLTDGLKANGWDINHRKTRFLRTGRRQYVTGVGVNDTFPRAPRAMKRATKTHLHALSKIGADDFFARSENPSKRELLARINYIRSIEPALGTRLLQEFHLLAPDHESTNAGTCESGI